jgi:RNA polymerase sigma-70 factor (ECF subfamily)
VLKSESDRDELLLDVIRKHWSGVWSYIFAIVDDRGVASDLTQDVFLRVYIHMDEIRDSSSRRAWIFRIAKNLSIDYHRSARMRRVLPIEPHQLIKLTGLETQSSEAEFMQVQQREHLENAIALLKPSYREVVLLRLREEMEFKEIAAILDIRPVAARARYRRAVAKLRRIYQERENAEKGDGDLSGLGRPTGAGH